MNQKTSQSKLTDDEFRQSLVELQNEACENFESLMTEIGADLRCQGKKYVGQCPVHGGDNPTGLNIYPEGDEIKGIWRCRTHGCHMKKHPDTNRLMYGQTLLGFIRGIQHYNTGKYPKLGDATKVLLKFCGYKSIYDVRIPNVETLKRRMMNKAFGRLALSPTMSNKTWPREKVRSLLSIPSPYYLNRGYLAETLDKYDVGTYNQKRRVAVPVYDDDYKVCVGFSGRTLYDECDKCSLYHDKDKGCPQTNLEKAYCVKWKNNDGFNTGHYLYNYWFSKDHILKSGTVILVEGPGDVWKLEEAGIHNAVALFGTNLTDEQRVILERSGALSAVVLLDGDKAGKDAMAIIKGQLERQFRLFFPDVTGTGDLGDLQTDSITSDIKPIIEQLSTY